MAPWCIYISCLERVARSGSGRDSVRGSVGAMNAELSRPDGLATVQSGRKQAQSRVCTPGLNDVSRIHQTFRCVIYIDHLYIYVYLLYRLGYSSNVRALSKRLRVRVRAASDLRSFELRAFRPMSCILVLSRPLYFIVVVSCMPIVTYFCSYVVT